MTFGKNYTIIKFTWSGYHKFYTHVKKKMVQKRKISNHVPSLIARTGFKKGYIAQMIGISPSQLSQAINGHRDKAEHREAVFCFLRHYLPEITRYQDVWLEDRPGTVYFKAA